MASKKSKWTYFGKSYATPLKAGIFGAKLQASTGGKVKVMIKHNPLLYKNFQYEVWVNKKGGF